MDIQTKAISSKAWFSECEQYRYTLIREFTDSSGILNFIMLNPSTATEQFNDPTVNRCEDLTLHLGFKYMAVTNIFAFRSTDPANLKKLKEKSIGLENNKAILQTAKQANMVICAWGNHGAFLDRGKEVLKMLNKNGIKLFALKINESGQPAHPLYLRKDLNPFLFFNN
jgi:hypothetical protein